MSMACVETYAAPIISPVYSRGLKPGQMDGLTNEARKEIVADRRTKLRLYLEENPTDSQDVDKLAKMFNVSARTIKLDFKEIGIYRRHYSKSTNDVIKYSKAFQRRSAIKDYIDSSETHVTIAELCFFCDANSRTIIKDLKVLGYINDSTKIVIPKRLCDDDIIKIKNDLKIGKNTAEIACLYAVSPTTISRIARGASPRSSGINYTNTNIYNRGRLSFREYQVLTLIKNHPGNTPIELLKLYKNEFVVQIRNTDELYPCLYRLLNLSRIYGIDVTPSRKVYYAYPVDIKCLRCGWAFPTSMEIKNQKVHSNVTNYYSYVNKQPWKCVKFTNKTKNQLCKESAFYVEFNKSCGEKNANGVRCGGQLTRGKDGVVYCRACGAVEEGRFYPGLENVATFIEKNLQIGEVSTFKMSAGPRIRSNLKVLDDLYVSTENY